MEGEIPDFSENERKRFGAERKEREFNKNADLVESSPFKSELENPVLLPVTRYADFIVRKSIVISKDHETEYRETRYADSATIPTLEWKEVTGEGKEFHLVAFHAFHRPEDSLYQAVYSEFVRTYLRELFAKNGKAYDVWPSLYNESGYAHIGFYWFFPRKRKFTFRNEDLAIDEEKFDHFKKVVSFDTKVGHEDGYFALNAIVWLDPKKELAAIESTTYEGFLEFLRESSWVLRHYCK